MSVPHSIILVTAIVTDSISIAPLISAILAPPQLLLLLLSACSSRLTCPVLAWLVVAGTDVGPGVVIGAMARIRLTCSVLACLVVTGTAGRGHGEDQVYHGT